MADPMVQHGGGLGGSPHLVRHHGHGVRTDLDDLARRAVSRRLCMITSAHGELPIAIAIWFANLDEQTAPTTCELNVCLRPVVEVDAGKPPVAIERPWQRRPHLGPFGLPVQVAEGTRPVKGIVQGVRQGARATAVAPVADRDMCWRNNVVHEGTVV